MDKILFFSNETYTEMVYEVEFSKSKKIKEINTENYQRLWRFDIITWEAEKLVVRLKKTTQDTNQKIGHGGRNQIEKGLHLRHKNITKEMIVIYLNLFANYEKKRNVSKNGLVFLAAKWMQEVKWT